MDNTELDLQKVVKEIFDENCARSPEGRLSDLLVQDHFVKSYKSRFFLELLQNARDAIVIGKVNGGKIKAWLEKDTFCFANNGADFNKAGVRSICYPAISTKHDLTMIGHKGIGFNSILEITDNPSIVTRYGTIYFGNKETAEITSFQVDELPLFQFPLYSNERLMQAYPELFADGFTTIFKLPLSKNTDGFEAMKQAMEITGQDIIFLSAITDMQIGENHKKVKSNLPVIKLEENNKPTWFRQYVHEFSFGIETVAKFDKDEREQFKKDPKAECRFLLQIDADGKFIPSKPSRLFLFYALKPVTGFSFSIHSFFSVTLDRKALSDKSELNAQLFNNIAAYYTGEFLTQVKKDFPDTVLDVLAYKREANNGLETLYDALKARLPMEQLISHKSSDRYLRPDEIFLVTKQEIELFKDGKLGDKFLLHVSDSSVENWLVTECKAAKLGTTFIAENIETKCKEYVGDVSFFEKLYDLNATWNINLKGKKVLLTQNRVLVSGGDSDIYYQRKTDFRTPQILDSHLGFLIAGIKVEHLREGARTNLGLKEYSEDNLMTAALSLFGEVAALITAEQQNIGIEIIRFLKRLKLEKEEAYVRLMEELRFPVVRKSNGQRKWENLLSVPVYFEPFEYSQSYNDDYYFIDLERIEEPEDLVGWQIFFKRLGVWNMPAAFVCDQPRKMFGDDTRVVINDREFHSPKGAVSANFAPRIISNWLIYHNFILGSVYNKRQLQVEGERFTSDEKKISLSGIYNYFRSNKWLPADIKGQKILVQPGEVVAISQTDYFKTQNQLLRDYLPILVLDQQTESQFIKDFQIVHLSNYSTDNYRRLLRLVSGKYADLEAIQDRANFDKFYNRILSYLFDCLNTVSSREYEINSFKEELFLTRSLTGNSLKWLPGKDAIHIDQKELLDKMDSSGLVDKIREPFSFTKRDRTEWGRFGARIGRQLSKIINTNIISEGDFTVLSMCLKDPEVAIAFVEDDQNENFTDTQLEAFRGEMISIHKNLLIEVKIEDKAFQLDQDFIVEDDGENTVLHIDESLLISRDRVLSKALAEYFESFTGNEMKRLDLIIDDIQRLNSLNEKYEYATFRNIDSDRLEELSQVLNEGSVIEVEIEVADTPAEKIQTGSPATSEAIITVQEDKQVKEITLNEGFESYFDVLDGATGRPVKGFEPVVPGDDEPTPPTGRAYNNGGWRPGTELSDKSKKEVGFFAEYYVAQLLTERHTQLFAQLGLDLGQEINFTWYNEPRVKNFKLPDFSVGKGCDIIIENLNIFIEVKGMVGNTEYFNLTGPEFVKLKKTGNSYFLIFVKNVYNERLIESIVVRDPYREILSGGLRFLESKVTTPL